MLCSPSAKKADEDLIIGRKREIVTRSCTARPVGCGVGVIATIRDPASHLLSTAFPIYPFTRLLSPVPADSGLGRKLLADSFAIYARVLEAIQSCLEAIESVSMDMWPAFINATLEMVPGAESKIAFDKFHVAKYLGEAVDKVRREEHRKLMKAGKADLKGTKYDWLSNPKNMTRRQKQRFKALRDSTLKTARAWAIKELAMSLWGYVSKTWARKGWARWLSWAVRCRLEPMKKVAKTIKKHLWGILNAIVLKVSNGPAEGINSRIKAIKVRSHGFRNKERFANAIYFHLGGLDLYPEAISQQLLPT